MSDKRNFNKLPEVLQTETQSAFYDATVEQLFSKKNSEKIDAYIGRRIPGSYDPIKDYYKDELTKNRTWYQLEPIGHTKDEVLSQDTNEVFYEDLIDSLKSHGSLIDNHNRLFSSEYYSFAPPIDIDMFMNFQSYRWCSNIPAISLNFDDYYIENSILGQVEFTVGDIIFQNGLVLTFPDSINYKGRFTVEGTGQSITLVKETLISVDDLSTPDYMTITRGSYNNNPWSRTNKWYHSDVIYQVQKYLNLEIVSERAKRPIIQFNTDLELFKFGVKFVSTVTDVSSISFSSLYGINITQSGEPNINGNSVLEGNTYVFENNETYTFPGTVSFVAATQPFNFRLPVPFKDSDQIVVNVTRGLTTYSNVNWFTIEDQDNILSFFAKSKGLDWLSSADDIDGLLPGDIVNISINDGLPYDVNVTDYIWQATINLNELNEEVLYFVAVDKNSLITDDSLVLVDSGNNAGLYFVKSSNGWGKTDQQKYDNLDRKNHEPLFNLYYTMYDSYGNPKLLSDFNDSTFKGSKIFSYKRGNGVFIDEVLKFSLEYKNLGQVADIVFQHDLMTNREYYILNGSLSEIPGYYYFKEGTETFQTTWVPFNGKTKQKIVDRFVVQEKDIIYPQNAVLGYELDSYSISNVTIIVSGFGYVVGDTVTISASAGSNFEGVVSEINKDTSISKIDIVNAGSGYTSNDIVVTANHSNLHTCVFELSCTPDVLTGDYYDISGVLELKTLSQLVDFKILKYNNEPTKYVQLINSIDINVDNVIQFKMYSAYPGVEISGYYEIPPQLSCNPTNEEIFDVTLNELSPHFSSIMENQVGFVGNTLSNNNYRFTAQDISLGSEILQSRDSILKAMLFTNVENLNIMNAISFNKTEQSNTYDKFVKFARQQTGESNITTVVDHSLSNINNVVQYFNAFTTSGMVQSGEPALSKSFTNYTGSTLTVSESTQASLTDLTIYVYIDGVLKLIDIDYTVVSVYPVTINLTSPVVVPADVIVNIFDSSTGNPIPATPAKLGCSRVYKPEMYLDDTFSTPTYVLKRHDGSISPLYVGIDSVIDGALYEYECRVFNGIYSPFKNEYMPNLTIYDCVSGAFRNSEYSQEEFNQIKYRFFLKWKSKMQLNHVTHEIYDVNDWKTWNYKDANPDLPGNWKGIYLYYYDTYRPHTHPWEMLGFSIKPDWWDDEYTSDYASTNVSMWEDISQGLIRQGIREGVDNRFVRPNLSFILPVDFDANLKAPHFIGIADEPTDKSMDWEYGDHSPVEDAWYRSVDYTYSILSILFLMKPSGFCEKLWNTGDLIYADINDSQLVSRLSLQRDAYIDEYVHGEIVDGVTKVCYGYQRFICDYLLFLGKDLTVDFGNKVRSLNVKLGHKFGGFSNIDTLDIFMEGTTSSNTSSSLIIPKDNINLKLHTGSAIEEYVYSGVAIRIVTDGFEVYGYDELSPYFKYYTRNMYKPISVNVGATPAKFRNFANDVNYSKGEIVKLNYSYFQCMESHYAATFDNRMWKTLKDVPVSGGVTVKKYPKGDTLVTIPYGFILNNIQEVYDFLLGYGDYLESKGWVFTTLVSDTGITRNWENSAKDFLFWYTSNWKEDNTILLSPAGSSVELNMSRGYAGSLEKNINNISNILDSDGYSVPIENLHIKRNDMNIAITETHEQGLFCVRVSAYETEHIVTIDNNTVFDDVIYVPLLNVRQDRLKISGYRTKNWFGKMEAPGYLILGDKIYSNVENIVSSIIDYHNTEVPLDNQDIENAARHLIGYERKDYMDALLLTGDVQYKFYQGMIREKGTKNSFNKLLRTKSIASNQNIEVNEEWAFKLSEFGRSEDQIYSEFIIPSDLLKTDTQVVKLDVSDNYSYTSSVSRVVIKDANTIYTSVPKVIISKPSLNSEGAFANAVIDTYGYLTDIIITNTGSGYDSEPTIKVVHSDKKDAFGKDIYGSDVFEVVMQKNITEDELTDQIIVIDVDDTEKWIHKPSNIMYTDLIQTISLSDITTNIPNAGYVSLQDVDFTSFNIPSLFDLYAVPEKPTVGSYIWIANMEEIEKTWDVFLVIKGDNADHNLYNDIKGYVSIANELFTYGVDNGITYYYDLNNNDVTSIITSDVKYTSADKLVFQSRRNVISISGKNWIDSYNDSGWAVLSSQEVIRKEEPLVNNYLLENMFVYDLISKETLIDVPVYDPFKGIIPGIADRNIKYLSDEDPAKYTNSLDVTKIDLDMNFNSTNVGEIWWDLSTCRYMYYEQGDLLYRRDNWGKMFPGSEVNIYEWVESNNPPINYTGDGVPKNTEDYVSIVDYSSVFGKNVTKYYFWVTNKREYPSNLNNRTMSTSSIATLITNPRSNGYEWFSYVDVDSFVFSNINRVLFNNQCVLQLNQRQFSDTRFFKRNVEWKLIKEGDQFNNVPKMFWDKLISSLCLKDLYGNTVPDINLSKYNRYGNKIRPRQTWFVDTYLARKVFVEKLNSLLDSINANDEYPNWASGITTSDTWYYGNWWAEGYSDKTKIDKQVLGLEIASIQQGDINKIIKDITKSKVTYYIVTNDNDGEQSVEVIGREKAKIVINDIVYKRINSLSLNDELQSVIYAIITKVLINENEKYANPLFFAMVHYVLYEQKNVDWVFKTSYLQINQKGEELSASRSYVPSATSHLLSYINETKPYSSKIRKYTTTYTTPIDNFILNGYDFDSLSYDNITGNPITGIYLPTDVPRIVKVKSIYNTLQCSFKDRQVYVPISEKYIYSNGTRIYSDLDVYNVVSVYVDGMYMDKKWYTLSGTNNNITLEFLNGAPRIESTIKIISGVMFTHTKYEEMRVSAILGNTDAAYTIMLDLETNIYGKFKGGFGASPFGFASFGAKGGKIITNEEVIAPFVINVGASARDLIVSQINQLVTKSSITSNVPKYSDYTERFSLATQNEQKAYTMLHDRFDSIYGCDLEGDFYDGGDFEHEYAVGWDVEPWDSTPWDEHYILVNIITPSVVTGDAYIVSTGGINYSIPYLVDINSINLIEENGGITNTTLISSLDYTISYAGNTTRIVLADVPPVSIYPLGPIYTFVFNYTMQNENEFLVDPSEDYLDSSYFANEMHDPDVTDELATYHVTESIVLTVDINASSNSESFVGDGIEDTYVLVDNTSNGIGHVIVTIDNVLKVVGVDYNIGIDNSFRKTIIFTSAPANGEAIKVTYSFGALQKIYGGDSNSHWDATVDNVVFYDSGKKKTVDLPIQGWGVLPFDADSNYCSKYLIPVSSTSGLTVELLTNTLYGLSTIVSQVEGVDYVVESVSAYITYLQGVYTLANTSDIRDALRSQYSSYIEEMYGDTVITDMVFDTFTIVRFNTEHVRPVEETDVMIAHGHGDANLVMVTISLPNSSFRKHIQENGATTFTRNSDTFSAILYEDLNVDDVSVNVIDVTGLETPTANNPGVIWIKGERIEYQMIIPRMGYYLLYAITRATKGTSMSSYVAGTKVFNGNQTQYIPDAENSIWENSIEGIAMSTTQQANFLNAERGVAIGQ